MGFLGVNTKLLPIKLHYFFLLGGTSPFSPFLTTICKQRGYSAFLVGIMFLLPKIITVLFRPLIGAITDRFRCQKTTFLWFIVLMIIITASYGILPDSPKNIDNSQDAIVLRTYQFWMFFIFLLCRNITLNVVDTLSDTICLQNLGNDKQKFGKQRLWGCIGWGSGSMITGCLIDWFSDGNSSKNYMPGLVISLLFLTADFLNSFQINDYQSHDVSTNMFKDMKKVFNDFKTISFFVWIVFFGIFYGSISLYLLWHLEELVTKYHPEMYSSIKTIQGVLFAVKCFAGEAPFFFLSSKIIKKCGHLNSIMIGLATLSLRFFLYYVIKNPMLIVPVELLSGLSFALPYSAMAAYGGVIAPKGLEGTFQGMVGAVFQGIGKSLGSLITGYLFSSIGSSRAYLFLCILALIVCIVQTITVLITNKLTKTEAAKKVDISTLSIKI